jgi:hypothetical protein
MEKFSTSEAAKRLGIHRVHLQRVMAQRPVKAPPIVVVGGVRVRLWTITDVERVRKALEKAKRKA